MAKILVVDDEASIRFALEKVLTRDGHQVVAVESGEAALEEISEEEFDLALIDLRLKGMGGMEVLAALRQQSPATVPIVLTAHASLESAVEALRQGAHDYLFKPCKTVELRDSVRTGLLKRRQDLRQRELLIRELLEQLQGDLSENIKRLQAEAIEATAERGDSDSETIVEEGRFLQRGDLIVDLMRHVITLDGQLLELSPTEFDLLAYLVSEAPRVISPQELVREVHGYESEPWEASDAVRSHIYRIRRKIKQATDRKGVIRTVRGVGYALDEEYA